jgi:hypothetical protein
MKKFTTAVVMVIVLSLGIFASVAAAANGNGNGNGGMDKGGTNTCQPGFHDQAGTCVHNGDAAGNCGQNQSGDTGNGNGSNQGSGGDKGVRQPRILRRRYACCAAARVSPAAGHATCEHAARRYAAYHDLGAGGAR